MGRGRGKDRGRASSEREEKEKKEQETRMTGLYREELLGGKGNPAPWAGKIRIGGRV